MHVDEVGVSPTWPIEQFDTYQCIIPSAGSVHITWQAWGYRPTALSTVIAPSRDILAPFSLPGSYLLHRPCTRYLPLS